MRGFINDSARNTFGNGAYALAQFLIVLACARSIGEEGLAVYSLAAAICAPLMAFGGLNIRQLASSVPAEFFSPRKLRKLHFVGLTVALLVASIIALVISINDGRLQIAVAVVLFCLGRFLDQLAEMGYGLLQRDGRFSPILVSKCLRAFLVTIAFVVGVAASDSLNLALFLYVLASLSVLLLNDIKRLPSEPESHKAQRGLLLKFGLTSAIGAALDALIASLPRVVLADEANAGSLAVFTVLLQFPLAASIAVSGVGAASIPAFRRATTKSVFIAVALKACAIALSIALIGAVAANLIGAQGLDILYGDAYSGYARELVWMMIGGGFWFLAGINGCALSAKGRYELQLASTFAGALICLIVLTILPPSLESSIWAYLIGMLARYLASLVFAVRMWRALGDD